MTRLLRSLLAIAALAAILVGAPWLLTLLGQRPGFLPGWERIPSMLLSPDGGRFLLVLVWAAAWLLWAWLAVLILIELSSLLRGVKAPAVPASSLAQGLVRVLVVAAAAAFIATPVPVAAAPPVHAAPDMPSTAVAAPQAPRDVSSGASTVEARTRPTEVEQETVTLKRGDTLWDLAEEHLGDPLRWPEIYELNKGIRQPSGYALTDPDEIDIGWTLRLPTTDEPADAEPKASEREEQPTTEEPAADATSAHLLPKNTTLLDSNASESAIPTPAAAGASDEILIAPATEAASSATAPAELRAEVAPAAQDQNRVDASNTAALYRWQVAGLLGAGVFLGAGIAAALAARRRDQFRARRPGRMIPAAPTVVAPIEMTSQVAAGLSARLVSRLDQVLRRIDPATELRTVTVARDGTIWLHTDTELAEPWLRDQEGWVLATSTPTDSVGETVADQPCAFPLLVTIGSDARDRVVLLNLEHQGVLSIAGSPVMSDDFVRYLAAELAVNPWSEGVRICCHGPAAQVIPMAPDRLDAHPDEVLNIASTNTTRATKTGVSATVGRAGQIGEDTWAAAALFTDTPSPGFATAITEHPGRTGTALVIQTTEAGDLNLTDAGRVHGLGLELTAVGLTEDEAAGCAALLAAADQADDAAPVPVDELVDVTGNLLPENRAGRNTTAADTVEAILPATDDAYVDAAAVTASDLSALAPRVPDGVATSLRSRDPGLDAQVRAWFSPNCPYPRLTLLGPVQARCYGKPIAKQKAYYTEALAYLALHPQGVTSDQVADAFGITVPRARTVISNLRQWVGENSRTRSPHIPDAKSSAQAQASGVGLYQVEDLLVDADLFRRLRARGLAGGPDGIEDLEAALQLVSGRPFDQLRPGGWTWLIDGDRTDQHMVCAVADVAHILVTHHLHNGDLEAAKRAATISIQADPESETARLDLACIMVQEGHSTSARQIVADALGDDAELDCTSRAAQILAAKDWLKTG